MKKVIKLSYTKNGTTYVATIPNMLDSSVESHAITKLKIGRSAIVGWHRELVKA